MGLAFPLGLAAAALVAPLVLLYVLKLRRREVVVASTLPWRRVLQERRANSPWEKLRRNLLLLLQLLALLLLVLAFAGPYRRAETSLSGDTILVLDVSASMGARLQGGTRTRMDEAKDRLAEALLSVEGGRRAALVLAGPEPRVAAPIMGERAPLQRALSEATVAAAPADLAAALELAASLARGAAAGEVLLVTDGAFDPTPSVAAALGSIGVLGVAGDDTPGNAGITSVALRPVAGEAGSHELFVGVLAAGMPGHPIPLVVEAGVAAQGLPDPSSMSWTAVAEDSVPAQDGPAARLLRVGASPGTILRVRLDVRDALDSDDEALVVVRERPTRRVLLSSPSPFLLQRALQSLPSVELLVTPDPPGAAEGYDAVVLEGPLPELLPLRPLLAFGTPNGASGQLEEPRIVRWQSRHPALRHARFDAVRVGRAHDGPLPPGAEILVESDQGPLAVTWPAPGGRALAFRFDLTETDLALRVTFPVLVADAVDWLTEGGEQDGVIPAGSSREIAMPGALSAELVLPGGERRELQVRAGAVSLPPLHESGLALLEADGAAPRLLASALLSPEESDLSARGIAGLGEHAAGGASASATVPGRRHLWPWAVALALGVLMAEWAVHHRRRE